MNVSIKRRAVDLTGRGLRGFSEFELYKLAHPEFVGTIEQYFQSRDAAAVDAARPSGLHYLAEIGGTPNAITGNSPTFPGAATGNKILFRPSATNTGPVTLNVNGIGPAPIAQADGGSALAPGDLRAGFPYILMFSAVGGNWQMVDYGHLRDDVRQAFPDYAIATGSPDAIVLSSPLAQQPTRGFSIAFTTSNAPNTGPVTIALNGGGPRPLLKGGNSQLKAGDLPALTKVRIVWDGLGGAIWSLESVGLPTSDLTPTTVRTFRSLEARRDAKPQGVSAYAGGVRTTAPTVIPIVGVGTSVGRGADLTPPNYPNREAFNLANAPMQYFVNAMAGVLGHGIYSLPYDNQSISGSFDDNFGAQLAASGFNPKLIVPIIAGMNSGSMFGVHAIGADYEIATLRATLRAINAAGGVAILCNTLHPHPGRIADQTGSLANGIAWPADQKTLAFFGLWSFDSAAQTLTSAPDGNVPAGAFASDAFGGTKIKVGSKLLIQGDGSPGSNAGRTLTVTQRVSDTVVKVTPGDITQTIANTPAFVRHVFPPVEEIMTVPPSKQRQMHDWTGHGIPVEGLASFSLYNKMLSVLAHEEDVILVDMEYRGFTYAERYGWDAIYTATFDGVTQTNINHPVLAAQRVIYGQPLAQIGADFARGTLKAGYQAIRGPAIL